MTQSITRRRHIARRIPKTSTAADGPSRARFWKRVLAIFVVALLVRLAHLWQLQHSPFFSVLMGDSRGYDEWAQRLAAGDWIGRDVFYQAPLYPYLLGAIYALFGRDLLVVRIVQAVLGSAACVLLGLAGVRLFSPRVGLVTGLMLALYAPAIFLDALIQKSGLDIFLICVALWLVSELSNRRAALAGWMALGVTLGALSLTRENALVLVSVVLVWAVSIERRVPEPKLARRARFAGVVALLLGLAIVLVPVAARNKLVGGGFYLTTSQFGPNFYIGNNPRADGSYMSLREGRGDPAYERQDATELAEQALGRRLTPAEVSLVWRDRALQFIASEPRNWLKLLGRKVLLLLNATEMLDTEA
ncbi:MAG: ArnT family glycosyltransferase, partial [Vicinamibacterales bacterium]